jgi:PhoH-like ATPase
LHLVEPNKNIYSIRPRNKEQVFALDILMDPEIEIVTLTGPSGTGKTLLSLAAGMEQVDNRGIYDRFLVSRPAINAGKELGFAPGSIEEKLRHWMKPIYDNFDILCNNNAEKIIREMKEFKKLQMESLQHIRGRSIPKQFFLIDEAQNINPSQIKLIVTRAAKGTKVVITGDVEQIDDPYLSHDCNALSHIKENFVGQDNYGHISMVKGERSRLAEQAAKLL